jgi:hypothetical protein
MSVAPKAHPGEVTERISASVFLGNDVFYLKRSNNVSFGEMAILTYSRCPPRDRFLGRFVHPRTLGEAVSV